MQRRRSDQQLAMVGAYYGEYFHREGKRLGPLAKYLRRLNEGSATTNAMELATSFKALGKRGFDIKVRRIPKG